MDTTMARIAIGNQVIKIICATLRARKYMVSAQFPDRELLAASAAGKAVTLLSCHRDLSPRRSLIKQLFNWCESTFPERMSFATARFTKPGTRLCRYIVPFACSGGHKTATRDAMKNEMVSDVFAACNLSDSTYAFLFLHIKAHKLIVVEMVFTMVLVAKKLFRWSPCDNAFLSENSTQPARVYFQAMSDGSCGFSSSIGRNNFLFIKNSTGEMIGHSYLVSVHDTQVHPQEPGRVYGVGVGQNTVLEQVELPILITQVSLSAHTHEPLLPILTADERHDLPALQGEDGNPIHRLVGEKPIVQDDGPVAIESVMLLPVSAESLNDLADGANRHLGRQAKLLSHPVVALVMQTHLRGRLDLVGYVRDVVTSFVECLHGVTKHLLLGIRRQQLELERKVHALILTYRPNVSIGKCTKVFA